MAVFLIFEKWQGNTFCWVFVKSYWWRSISYFKKGINEDWYADQPADFIVETAHAAIDAGADIVVGHGAHFLRGVEHYREKVIFYNLGSFLMEFEAGESIIPPEMNAAYDHDEHALP